jgi:hypothetical protein
MRDRIITHFAWSAFALFIAGLCIGRDGPIGVVVVASFCSGGWGMHAMTLLVYHLNSEADRIAREMSEGSD